MGADFLIYAAPMCRLTLNRRRRAERAIQSMSDRQIIEHLEEREGLTYTDDEQFEGCAVYRTQLLEDLRFYAAPYGREVIGWLPQGCDRGYFVTGGMSYGHIPSEAADVFRRLASCQRLWRLFHQWAVDDETARRAKIRRRTMRYRRSNGLRTRRIRI
jgi:hypothetical protein